MSLLRPLARIWTGLLAGVALALVLALTARTLAPLAPWADAPTLVASDPRDGAMTVLPRAAISLSFNAPMNRASVEAALRVEPPTPGSVVWSPDATTLTFRPTPALTPAASYTVSLGATAQGRWWRSLAAPVELRFATAAQPAVVAALPAGPGAPIDTALAVVFSQPMVAPAAVGQPANLPELRIAPPLTAQGRWLDQQTLLLTPVAALAPATRYELSLDASLTDLRGVELGAPVRWGFTTAWPALIERSPPDQARWVSPREPLRLRLAAPLDPDLLRQALRLSPPLEGELTVELDGTTQLVSFTPRDGWAYDTSYRVELVAPPGSELGPPEIAPWSFSVEPQPRLVAFFPGQGQILAPGEPIRLVFSTPMDEAGLRAGLRIEPPVGALPLSVSETEVRLLPELQPSTLYTITLAAETRDRADEPLGSETLVRLRTAPARPTLSAPAAFARLLSLPVGAPATVALEATNLSMLELSLYPLDQATLLRVLDLRPDEWVAFSPERYGQALARSWRVAPGAALDMPQQLDLPVGLSDGEPLAPGAYYLRATSPEGPRTDLVLLVADTRLALRQGEGQALLWATNAAGAPLDGLPVALYQSGALLGRGQTDADGLWLLPLTEELAAAPLLALAEGDGPALARSDWLVATPPAAPPRTRALLLPDQLTYAPGERVQVRGIVRRVGPDGALDLPAAATPCRLQLRMLGGAVIGASAACQIEAADGTISGMLPLAARLDPGSYSLLAQIGDASLSLPISVIIATEATVTLSARPSGAGELELLLSREALPEPATTINWSLQLEPLAAPPPPAGFTLGPPETAKPLDLEGVGASDSAGRLRIALPATSGAAYAYHLRAETVAGPLSAEGLLSPGPTRVAVGLPSRIIASDQRSTIALLARDGLGRPLAGAALTLEIYRVGAPGQALLSRRTRADDDGRAEVELVQLSPGAYELVATAAGGPATRTGLWVYGAGFSAWPAAAGALTVVADRDRYAAGEVATLLVAAPALSGSLLLTVEGVGLPATEVRAVSTSQLIRLPISAEMAPGVVVSALLAGDDQHRAGATVLHVSGPEAPLEVTVASAASDLLPGASTPITITTSAGGIAVPTDLLVALAPAAATSGIALAELQPGPPSPSRVAALPPPGAQPAAPSPAPPASAQPPGALVTIDASTGAPGLSLGSLTMPAQSGEWTLSAYAIAEQFAAGSATLSTSQSLSYRLVTPPHLGRADRAELSLYLHNTSPLTREIAVRLGVTGLELSPPAPDERRLTLAPDERTRLDWTARPEPAAASGRLRLTLTSEGLRERLTHDLAISAPPSAGLAGTSLVGAGPLSVAVAPGGDPAAPLTIALTPSPQAALVDQALALAALPDPSVEEQAALTIIAARLADQFSDDEQAAWKELARAGLVALEAAQGEDGGWGWWPATPTQPFVTALALEAQLTARAVLDDQRPTSLRAIAYLGRVTPSADLDTQAYIAYVRARAGHTDPGATALAEADLQADGLAFLALSLPPAQAAPLLDRLLAQAEATTATPNQAAALRWGSDEPAGMPRTPATLAAAAAQALRASRPSAPQIPGIERTLLGAWGVAGWPSAYEAARVALALPARAPAPGGGPTSLSMSGAPLLDADAPLTATLRLSLPANELPERPTLAVEARGAAPFMLAYSRPAAPAPAPARLALAQDLIDPTTGAVLDPATLRLGQLVGLRLSIVVARPTLRAELSLALPAGLEALPGQFEAPFQLVGPPHDGLLRIDAAPLAPGVYTQIIPTRAAAGGRFSAPPALLRDSYSAAPAVAAPQGLTITIGE